MTAAEAISNIEVAIAEVEWEYPIGYAAAFEMAIEALREKQEREDPKPLTIEELAKMHGEPIWVAEREEWAIVEVDTNGKWAGKPFANGNGFNYDITKRKLHCYRYKPKEADHAAEE